VVFGIDDSEIEISGQPHILLAGVGVRMVGPVETALAKVKHEFGLSATEEVKWNGMRPLPRKAREELSQELMILLRQCVSLVSINEGRDKQAAAVRSVGQIADFIKADTSSIAPGEAVELLFDEGIIDDLAYFKRQLHVLSPSPVTSAAISSVRSHESALIQLADILAGFNRLATEVVLGGANKQILVWDDVFDSDIPIDLLSYITIGLREGMCGEVPAPPDPHNFVFDATWPFRYVGGYGLRIHSSISPKIIRTIYKSRRVYVGCLM